MATEQQYDPLIEQYLMEPQTLVRLKLLASLKKQGTPLPLELVADLMLLDLPISEKQAILTVTDSSDPLEFEKFLTDNLMTVSQELATSYINTWTAKSPHLLGYRLQRVATARHTPQRVRYTILSSAWHVGGQELIEKFANLDGLEELSQAFHALLLEKAVAWNIDQPRLLKIAKTISHDLREELHPSNKALSAALYYLARFHPSELEALRKDQFLSSSWQALVQTLDLDRNEDLRPKIVKPKSNSFEDLWQSWPPIWQRSQLGTDTIYAAMQIAASEDNQPRNNIFQGVDQNRLTEAWERCTNREKQELSERFLSGYLAIEEALKYKNMPNKTTALAFVKEDTKIYLSTEENTWSTQRSHTNDRQIFFDGVYRNTKNKKSPQSEPWKTLYESYQTKTDEQIDKLVSFADQSQGVFKLCFLNALGSFKDSDRAVLKLLGYLRSTEDHELESMIQALGDIGTARAGQELLKVILRPNLSQSGQIKIIRCLEKMDTSGLQTELRGAIAEIQTLPMGSAEKDELTESLASLLISNNTESVEDLDPNNSTQSAFTVDEHLTKVIACYPKLSGEVKRALRTGQFFHNQVRAHQNSSSIDLSPVIDMQYKALEIFLRESFENIANQLIHDGVLQRKLDIIGYARPIPEKMTAFENYIGNQPIVKEIPFFSKFKLRKMLRGLCQFKPGKRFTLDGLKAFGLFFLCFSRKKCTYGLANLLPLPFPNDQQLAQFCKQLHIFQDFRNRAVHEGLPPGAANNIEMTWKETAEIIVQIHNLNSILEHVKAQTKTAPTEVIIQRKGA